MLNHPMQPVYLDEYGVVRFKTNKIVELLLARGPFNLNDLACMDLDKNDREQLAQLIGYSVSGFTGLSYVSDKTRWAAEGAAVAFLKELAAYEAGA